jgi:uncharacterized protein (TIGR00725 family)
MGRALIDNGYGLVTGGLNGVMEAACEGARSSPAWSHGKIIGLLPGSDPGAANPFVDIAIPTGLEVARNILVARSDALIAIGGGAGTLSEMALAWQLKRLVIAFRVEGWSGKLADTRLDERIRYRNMNDDRVFGVDAPKEAITILRERLDGYPAGDVRVGSPTPS